jgi:hypothetical protein
VNVLELLDRLERLKTVHGGDAAAHRLELLRQLDRRRLPEPEEVERLHECLCFARAYPDNREVLGQVEAMLAGFAGRSDLKRFRRYLGQTAIAGTEIQFPFFWPTARWLARRWPDSLHVDWSWWDKGTQKRLVEQVLPLILPYSETPALDMEERSAKDWLARLKGGGEGDAGFLIRRFETLPGDRNTRESLFDSLDVPVIVKPGEGTPNRTQARYPKSPVTFQVAPMDRTRPSLKNELERPPASARKLPPREADVVLDLTREAMVNRLRDLYSFSHADRNDVRLVNAGDGLQFACIGTLPERRLMLESVYGFLTLKNGVPIGYVLASTLFGSTEVAYNVFKTFRSGEAARVFGRVLAMCRHLFGSRSFSIDPYQLGYGNQEGLQSGAWWFYYKLGFRPKDPEVKRLVRGELAAMKTNPGHRTAPDTLERMASEYLYYEPVRTAGPLLGGMPLGNAGLRIGEFLAVNYGADREKGIRECAVEAGKLLGVRSTARFTPDQRLWWKRWSPLVLLLPGVNRWSTANRRGLVDIIKAKGGKSEIEFVKKFNRHMLLQRALVKLILGGG